MLFARKSDTKFVLDIRDLADGRRRFRKRLEAESTGWPRFSPTGSRLALPTCAGIFVFDAAAGKQLALCRTAYDDDPEPLMQMATFSPDGRLLAASLRYTMRPFDLKPRAAVVFDVETGHEVARLTFKPDDDNKEADPFRSIAVSSDGRFLATAHPDEKGVRMWELGSGRERGRFNGHRDTVRSLAFAPDGRTLLSGSDDGTVLVWNLDGPISQRKQSKPCTAQDAAARWDDLAGLGGTRIDDAVWALARSPDVALPLLREKLRPANAPSPEMLAPLVSDLVHDEHAKRQAAAHCLQSLQEPAETALRAARKKECSAEARRALDLVLESFADKSPETLQRIRAVEVLERIATPEARKLLDTLAEGAPQARLTREAKAVVERLERR
jgi:hypothetical protein